MSTDSHVCDVTFSGAEGELAGSLALPDQAPPTPGVVLVGGSGPSDRTNDTYFIPIRRHLAGAGITVLSYDKRGVGASSGDWRGATMDDLAKDASAALDFLRAQPGVQADAVGLFGHSEGGWVVLRAATGRDDVPWVITNSCPGMSPAAQDRYALANALRRAGGIAQRDVDGTLACYDRVVEAGRRDVDFAGVSELVRSVDGSSLFADHYWGDMDEGLWGFLKRKQDHDPVPDAVRLRCPHLAIFGGADPLVPVADSVHLFSGAVCHPERDHRAPLTVKVFPGADHRIHLDEGTRLAHGYLTTLSQWITDRTVVEPAV